MTKVNEANWSQLDFLINNFYVDACWNDKILDTLSK